MDSAEIVSQQPVTTLLDFSDDGPNTREGPVAVPMEATSLYPTEPMVSLSKPEAATVLAEQELSMREFPTTAQFPEETNKSDVNGNGENVVDSCVSPLGRSPPYTVIVREIMDTVDIEVDLTAPATDAESRPHEGTVPVVSSMNLQQEAGHVGLLIYQADGKSNAEEIAVEVVLDNVGPPVTESEFSSLVESAGGLGGVPASAELVVETAEVGTVEGSSNVAERRGIHHSTQVENGGCRVGIEAAVGSHANNTANSTAFALVDKQGAPAAGAEETRKELDISSIAALEQKDVDVGMSDPTVGRNVLIMEKDSAASSRLEGETSIHEPRLMNSSEGEITNLLVKNITQYCTGDVSTAAMRNKIDDVLPVAVSQGALNATDHFTVDLHNFNAPEPASSAAATTLDHRVDIPVMSSETSVIRMVGGGSAGKRTAETELVSNNFVTPDCGEKFAKKPSILGEMGATAESTSISTADELKVETLGTRVVGDAGEESLSGQNAGLTDISDVGGIPMTSFTGEREQLSSSGQIKINEASFVHSVEKTDVLGPTEDNDDEVETSLELASKILIQIPEEEDKIEDPQDRTAKTETAPEETLIDTTLDNFQMDTGVKSSEERTAEEQLAVMVQEVIPLVTKDAGIPSGETMNNLTNLVGTTVVEILEGTEMVNPPAAKEESPVATNDSTVPEEKSGATLDDDLIDLEGGLVAIEETIDTTISITTIQEDNGGAAADDVDSHGVLIGVGSSVQSSGLTITEIADTGVTVEEFQVEQQSVWGLSEPLVTPPEQEIIVAIGDLCGEVGDIVHKDEPPQSTETLIPVLTVLTKYDVHNNESNDLQTSLKEETQNPSEPTANTQNRQNTAQSAKSVVRKDTEQQTTSETVVVDMAEPLDLQDEQSLLPTLKETEIGTADIAASRVSPPLMTLPANTQPTDIVAENIALHEASVQGQEDAIPPIAEAVDLPKEDEDVSLPTEGFSADSVAIAAEDETSLTPAFESRTISISTSLCVEQKLSSIYESATAIIQPVTRLDQDNATEGDASDVSPIANELGFSLETAAVDNSALSAEPRAMESSQAGGHAPVVEVDLDGRSNEQVVGCALNGSTCVLVDGLETVEVLERNEKKRAREEEEGDAVAEDIDLKVAKTSNGEISLLNDVGENDVKIGEDVQVDKKRSRDESEAGWANPSVSIQTKVGKTGTVDDYAVSQSRKADTDEEAVAEECVDMEDTEEVQEKIVKIAGQDSTAPRYKKRKIALFLGYSGAGYQGMQKNPGAITIEGELEEALFRAGAIAESNYGQPQKLDWRRAARTDKGVSAVGQVVSGCFFIDPPGFIERVNSHLPKQIRVYGYKRATAGFSSKKLCDRRKYEYVLPVYAFDPTVHLDRETVQALAAVRKGKSLNETENKATATEISGSAVETGASVVIQSEMKETRTEEGSTGSLVEPVGETVVSLLTDATNSVFPKIEGKEDKQSSSNGMSAATLEVTLRTEIAKENLAAEVPVQTEETLLEAKEVTVAETAVDLSPEEKEDMDEKESTAAVEVLLETKDTSTEQTDVTVPDTVINLSPEDKKEALDGKVKQSMYKFDEEEFNRLNRILKGFEGHHNFHNFTVRTKATDPSANRYIICFGVENTFIIDGIEFVRCSVVGQSFMLHQIRKMIGLAVAIMRGTAPESILATALRRDTKVNVPMAPELGLFLEECYYSAYNRRFKATHEEMSLSSFSAEANEFKKEFIYPHIGSTEAMDSTFAMWLHSLNDRHYPDFVAAREAEKLIKSQ